MAVEDRDLITLQYQELASTSEDAVIWLLGTYYQYVYTEAIEKDRGIGVEEIRGHLIQSFEVYKQKKLKPLYLPG